MDEYKNRPNKEGDGEKRAICPQEGREELTFLYGHERSENSSESKNKPLWAILVTTLAVALGVVCFIAAVYALLFAKAPNEEPVSPPVRSENEYFGVFENSETAKRGIESCVSLRAGVADELGGVSVSGVILSDDGWILSGAPVFKHFRGRIYARLNDGEDYAVDEVIYDGKGEMTLYKISADGLTAADIRHDATPMQGEALAAFCSFGAPDYACVLLSGIVSHSNRSVRVEIGESILRFDGLIQADISLGEGGCGAPAFDREGRLIGISARQGMSYFYGTEKIRSFLAKIKEY